MNVLLSFNGREYRLSVGEAERLATALAARADRSPRPGIVYRHLGDNTFGLLAERLRQAATPPTSLVELQGHEAAAVVLAATDVDSPELDRFYRDYAAENVWVKQPFSHIIAQTIEASFALKVGQWFFDEGLQAPIGGLDPVTGEDLPPREVDLASQAAANAAIAEAASMWARLRGSTFADQRVVADELLAWLRGERERVQARADASHDEVEQAEAVGRAWALREAGLWLEACANRARRPWEAPSHEA